MSECHKCPHARVRAIVFDQTAGVECDDCLECWPCWGGEHCSELLYNRAFDQQPHPAEWEPCKLSRHDHCFLCGVKFL